MGLTIQRELRIYALEGDGHLRPQIALTLDDEIYSGGITGKVRFDDRNQDGHPDLVLTSRSEYPDEGDELVVETKTTVYSYRPAHDDFGADVDHRLTDGCPEPGEPYSLAL